MTFSSKMHKHKKPSRHGQADGRCTKRRTVVVTKLDRMARSTRDGLTIIDEPLARGVQINILNMGKFDSSPTGKLMRTIFLAFAVFERDMIVSQTSEGKAVCRAHDPHREEDRKRKDASGLEEMTVKRTADELTIDECCRELGISRSMWYARSEIK